MTLPPLNILATRSFWAQIIGLAAIVASLIGLPGFDEGATVDDIMGGVGALLTAYGYFQRANPRRSITLTGPLE